MSSPASRSSTVEKSPEGNRIGMCAKIPTWLPPGEYVLLLAFHEDARGPSGSYLAWPSLNATWLVKGTEVYQRCTAEVHRSPSPAPSPSFPVKVGGAATLDSLTALLADSLGKASAGASAANR